MAEELAPQNSADTETKSDSIGSMFTNIFVDPVRVFRRVTAKPAWGLPLLVMLVVVAAHGFLVAPLQWEQQRQQIEMSTEMEQQQKEQALQGMEMMAPYSRYFGLLGTIAAGIVFFIVVGVLMLMGNVIFGGDANFKQVASVNAWAGIIGALGLVVKTALMLLQGTYDIRLSLAILLPSSDTNSTLYGLLNSATDIFTIWEVIVMIVGIAVVYKFEKGKAAAVVLIPLAVAVSVGLALSAVF
jgi:hypothetical protein